MYAEFCHASSWKIIGYSYEVTLERRQNNHDNIISIVVPTIVFAYNIHIN